jgi:lambda repressor-like predicted transcriptional regulator
MHPADITAALKKRGSSQSAVARSVCGRSGHAVTPGAVHLVVKGQSASRTIALGIAKATGIPVAQLWPGKYPDLEKLDATSRARAVVAKQVGAERAAHAAKQPLRRVRR